jgi:hypothetical protein
MKGNVFLPAISNSGEIHIAAGASAIINNTITSLAGSRITGPGTLSISGFVNNFAGTLELTGELWISSSIGFSANQTIAANFNLTGNVSGAGNLAINGPFTWTGGSMSGAGKTTIAAAAVATLGYSPQFPNSGSITLGSITLSRVLENAGTINLTKFGSSGASLNFSSGTLNNLAGASLNFSTENTSGGFNGSGTLNNAGTINVAGSSSFGPFNMAAVALNNTGVINIHSGGLSGSINNSGVINMYSGIALPFVNSGTLNFYSGGTVTAQNTTNTGTLRILG